MELERAGARSWKAMWAVWKSLEITERQWEAPEEYYTEEWHDQSHILEIHSNCWVEDESGDGQDGGREIG